MAGSMIHLLTAYKVNPKGSTFNHINIGSRCTCEKLGAKFIRVARLPEWHDLYKEGQRFVNIFEWSL